MKPGKTGIARIIDATTYSWLGFCAAFKHEAAFRQELSGRAKDMGSATVFMALSIVTLCWVTILGENYLA